jgi:hypothetical protein
VGKHTAADDSTVHPLVADALSRRAGAPAGEHSGGTGWPQPEREGGGAVGWPGDTDAAPHEDAEEPVARTAPPASRRGWRRLFGASPAA